MKDVVLFTEELLKQDYYYALLFNGMSYLFETREEMDRYHTLLPEINKLYTKGILSARLYDIADESLKGILLMGSLSEIKKPFHRRDYECNGGEGDESVFIY